MLWAHITETVPHCVLRGRASRGWRQDWGRGSLEAAPCALPPRPAALRAAFHLTIQLALRQPARLTGLSSVRPLVLRSPGAAGWRAGVTRRLPTRCCGRSTGSWGPFPSPRPMSCCASSCWSACGSPGTLASCPAGCRWPGTRARRSKSQAPLSRVEFCRSLSSPGSSRQARRCVPADQAGRPGCDREDLPSQELCRLSFL